MSQAFLVLFRTTMDDVPVKLFHDEHFAVMHAEIIGREALDNPDSLPEDVAKVVEVLGLPASGSHSVAVITLVDGVPTGLRTIVDLT